MRSLVRLQAGPPEGPIRRFFPTGDRPLVPVDTTSVDRTRSIAEEFLCRVSSRQRIVQNPWGWPLPRFVSGEWSVATLRRLPYLLLLGPMQACLFANRNLRPLSCGRAGFMPHRLASLVLDLGYLRALQGHQLPVLSSRHTSTMVLSHLTLKM